MSIATFKRAVKLASENDQTISIGGGEPTVHPKFWDMLGWAITHTDHEERKPWLATNGKKTQDALRLASLAKSGVISCDLSQDLYHEPIDERVISAFSMKKNGYPYDGSHDYRGVRNTSNSLINAG
jgi:MoaA/NifB/PqqE/SkfB family radical SAM enzyme